MFNIMQQKHAVRSCNNDKIIAQYETIEEARLELSKLTDTKPKDSNPIYIKYNSNDGEQ